MLVDNGNATDILYWDVYKKTSLTENNLSLTTSLLIHWGSCNPQRYNQASYDGRRASQYLDSYEKIPRG